MDTHDPDEYLPVEAAGNVAGINPRTLRYWVRGGKLPAIEGQRGKLVRLGDVLALADLTGKMATL
ncbi:MAG: helix-turn-helix domain-containing protein, partial [Chloroflexota bacterium]|nr:helix-turn-helix domain-containing protein [Chloroflexota bacterium]